jgi:hypothetical protein
LKASSLCLNSGDLDVAARRSLHLLAYYLSQRTSFSDFRRIAVSVSGVPDASAYRVRHRAGYYTVKSDF